MSTVRRQIPGAVAMKQAVGQNDALVDFAAAGGEVLQFQFAIFINRFSDRGQVGRLAPAGQNRKMRGQLGKQSLGIRRQRLVVLRFRWRRE